VVADANESLTFKSSVPQLTIYGGFGGPNGLKNAAAFKMKAENYFKTTFGQDIKLKGVNTDWQTPQLICKTKEEERDPVRRQAILDEIRDTFEHRVAVMNQGWEERHNIDIQETTLRNTEEGISPEKEKEFRDRRLALNLRLMKSMPEYAKMQSYVKMGEQACTPENQDVIEALRATCKEKFPEKFACLELTEETIELPKLMLPNDQNFVNITLLLNKTGDYAAYFIHSVHATEEEAKTFAKEQLCERFSDKVRIFTVQTNCKMNIQKLLDPVELAKVNHEFKDKEVATVIKAQEESNKRQQQAFRESFVEGKKFVPFSVDFS
jgi:hypothetical protein